VYHYFPHFRSGVTSDELSALYEHLAIKLQTKEIGMNNEIRMLRQRPKMVLSERIIGADRGHDARTSCFILQACGLPADEELLHIFKNVNSLSIRNLAGNGVERTNSSVNASFKQRASNLFKQSGSVFSGLGASQPGVVCIYQNVVVFCAKSLKNNKEVEEFVKGGSAMKKLCTVIR
jgi:hypothetical protein